MRRLLWKEWCERWPWLTLWLAAETVTAALGKGQPLLGWAQSPSGWMALPVLAALLAGLGGYGSELTGTRAAFLYSRPIGWGRIFAVKVLLGLAVTAVAATLGALAGYGCLPAEYHAVLTPVGLIQGALIAAAFTGGAFLLGLCGSVVLPGLGGALLTAFIWAVLVGLGQTAESVLYPETVDAVFLMLMALLAPVALLVLFARFGLTLSPGVRLRRVLLIALPVLAVCVLLDGTPLATAITRWFDKLPELYAVRDATVSPGGRYALVNYYRRDATPQSATCLLRLADGRTSAIEPYRGNGVNEVGWLTDDLFYAAQDVYGEQRASTLGLARWAEGQTPLRWFAFTDGVIRYSTLAVSPDGRRLLIGDFDTLELCNVDTGEKRTLASVTTAALRRRFGKDYTSEGLRRCWWQSNREAGYVDPLTLKRTIVRVE